MNDCGGDNAGAGGDDGGGGGMYGVVGAEDSSLTDGAFATVSLCDFFLEKIRPPISLTSANTRAAIRRPCRVDSH